MNRRSFRTECFSLTLAALVFGAGCIAGQAQAGQVIQRQTAAVEMTHVPVLRNNIPSGSIITQEDIAWVDLPAHQIGQNIVTDPQKLIGMAAAWPLPGNRPLRETDVRHPILAKKGTLVTMTFSTENMTLSATGRALENGSLGDRIRLVNTSSNKTVEGMVMADGSVNISRGLPAPTAQN